MKRMFHSLIVMCMVFGLTSTSYALIISDSFVMNVSTPVDFQNSTVLTIASHPNGQLYASNGIFLSAVYFDGTLSTSESLRPPIAQNNVANDFIYDSAGNLFLADILGGRILMRGSTESNFSTLASGISFPRDLAFDGEGNLIVSGGNGNINDQGSIWRVTPAGDVSLLVNNLLGPVDLEADNAGNIYAITFGGDIYTVSNTGTLSLYYSLPTNLVGSGIGYVEAFAIDSVGNIFASLNEGGRFGVNSSEIYRINPSLNLDLFAIGVGDIPVDMVFTNSNELLLANFIPNGGSNVTRITGDFSASSFNISQPPPSAIPEPTTLLLLSSGLVGLGLIRRKLNFHI